MVDRVTFEAMHVANGLYQRVGERLMANGFAWVYGGFKAPLSTWQRVNAAVSVPW